MRGHSAEEYLLRKREQEKSGSKLPTIEEWQQWLERLMTEKSEVKENE